MRHPAAQSSDQSLDGLGLVPSWGESAIELEGFIDHRGPGGDLGSLGSGRGSGGVAP